MRAPLPTAERPIYHRLMRTPYFVALACLVAVSLLPVSGRAETNQIQSFGVWKAEDNCAREAFKRSPDYTPEGNRKRDQLYRRCIDNGHLPPRDDPSGPAARPSPQPGSAQN